MTDEDVEYVCSRALDKIWRLDLGKGHIKKVEIKSLQKEWTPFADLIGFN